MKKLFFVLFCATFLFGCGGNASTESDSDSGSESTSQSDDNANVIHSVVATYETMSDNFPSGPDAADDAAIWINPTNPAKSLVIGTNKNATNNNGGIGLYTLDGNEVNYVRAGRPNNVDVRYALDLGNGKTVDFLGFSERVNNNVVLMSIDADAQPDTLSGGVISTGFQNIYGFCLYKSAKTGKYYAFANDKSGVIAQYEISADGKGGVTTSKVRELQVSSQPEGMAADDELGHLYVGEEDRGIWKFNAEPDGGTSKDIVVFSNEENPNIEYDIEGITIYKTGPTSGYLIASSQGNNSFAVFNREVDNEYIGSFKVENGSVDGVIDSDGVFASSEAVTEDFPKGVIVIQDGINTDGADVKAQNFKIVDFTRVLKALGEM